MSSKPIRRPVIGVLPGWQAYSGILFDSFMAPVIYGIRAACKMLGCDLLLGLGMNPPTDSSTNNRPAWPFYSPNVDYIPIGPDNCDGLIIMPPISNPIGMSYFQKLLEKNYPLVFAGDWFPGPGVLVDNEGGIHDAVTHLYKHGHRRIAFVAGDPNLKYGDSYLRLKGFQNALGSLGLPFNPALVKYGLHSTEGGYAVGKQMLAEQLDFTAVVCSNDQSAVGFIQAVQEEGKSVPGDIAVIGFDDRLEARANVPALTSVHYPMYELGYYTAEMLYSSLQVGTQQITKVPRVPTRLTIRESCGCQPGESYLFAEGASGLENEISALVFNDMHRIGRRDVYWRCRDLVQGFRNSLEAQDASIFNETVLKILDYTVEEDDDLHGWHMAISFLRDRLDRFIDPKSPDQYRLAVDMLDRARMSIIDTNRREEARGWLGTLNANEINGYMVSHFLSAVDEKDLFDLMDRYLPTLGIRSARIFWYEPGAFEPVEYSRVLSGKSLTGEAHRFPSRSFNPRDWFHSDEPLCISMVPMQSGPDAAGFIAFDSDAPDYNGMVTVEVLSALRGLQHLHEAVEARRQAEEANRLKSRFLSMVSHELRTPLNLITGLSNMLLRERVDTASKEARINWDDLERIYISAQHLDDLIRDVLDLARIDVAKLTLSSEMLVPADLLRAVDKVGEQLAQEKGLSWRFTMAKDLPVIFADRTRLRQVLLNLINNAVKFTASGEVALLVTAEAGMVVFSVTDTGLGIPGDEQQIIFDEFQQSERTTARGYGGLGLGLAICKRLVELHGGTISVASSGQEGQGSTFVFRIPAMENPAPSILRAPDGLNQRVAILVKDEGTGAHIQRQLASRGILSLAHAIEKDDNWLSWLVLEEPDAVVLDLGLTSQSGWEILRILKENPATQDLPVMFSSLKDDCDCGDMIELTYLAKPLGGDALLKTLKSQGLMEVAESGGSASILLVDDDPNILDLHARQLQSLSDKFVILQAQNGRQALEIARRSHPALMLLDLMMPDLDGFGVLEAMRDDPSLREVSVIVVTGQVLTEEDMERLNAGVTSVLSKGIFSAQETLEHVEAALARRRRINVDARQAVLKAMGFIHSHYSEAITRSDVAAHVGMSERHLTRCFTQEVGLTPITYLNRYRVQQAKELMQNGKRGITDIALEVGFSNSGYFTKVFRDETGLSPREFLYDVYAAKGK